MARKKNWRCTCGTWNWWFECACAFCALPEKT